MYSRVEKSHDLSEAPKRMSTTRLESVIDAKAGEMTFVGVIPAEKENKNVIFYF